VDPELFLADLEAKPVALRALADALATGDPWHAVPDRVSRVVFLGMGSSRYAALPVARRLRAAGLDATAEYASVERAAPADPQTLVVAVSNHGASRETVAVAGDYPEYVALTNTPDSPLAKGTDRVVPMLAGVERGGLASRSFQHSLILLDALASRLTGDGRDVAALCRRAADASEDLLERRSAWLPRAVESLDSGAGFFAIAPAERISSAAQSALITREGPYRRAEFGETGDWAHVDLYLTKFLDYRALFHPGSRWDEYALGWLRERSATVVAVGGEVPDAACVIRYHGDADPRVRLYAEVLVGELVATTWWCAAAH
jgi:glucosamine 6-phosphate synthetase-like amidotransferase/phosphosugar isomerase protein